MSGVRRRERGIVLVIVLIFLLLLVGSVATFGRRATLDRTIASNRDSVARAEALARGGVRLATALILEDRIRDEQRQLDVETRYDVWARTRDLALPIAEDSRLSLVIEDAGARLNLNALFDEGNPLDAATEVFLVELIDKAIADAQISPDEADYDALELARSLIDYIDLDETGQRGDPEDDYYQRQEPPYRAANRPLLSLDELALVRGFEPRLIEALRPYLTVYPYVDGAGINPNTAPPWVLGVLYHGVAGDYRFASLDDVQRLVRTRDDGAVLCPEDQTNPLCTAAIQEVVVGETFPPATSVSNVFLVTADARVGDVRRRLEAVLDRSDPREPLVLYWRVR